ncbi:MAG TPA: hypothetical protein VL977_06425, partial [Solirubrobacteraceae bacterium]|nr:hypothetical protein [Solirubrobacteraceae bacterium]
MRLRQPRFLRPVALLLALVLFCALGAAGSAAGRTRAGARGGPSAAGTRLPGTACPVFPADNVWNTPVTGLPVAPRSAAWLAHMDAGSTLLHPDYGPAGGGAMPYGIPWQITSRHPKLVRIHFQYASESNHGPYPFSA